HETNTNELITQHDNAPANCNMTTRYDTTLTNATWKRQSNNTSKVTKK
ncbi:1601_t:CDS:1, partial [Gigaspora rosea]